MLIKDQDYPNIKTIIKQLFCEQFSVDYFLHKDFLFLTCFFYLVIILIL